MATYRTTTPAADQDRLKVQALAALREASEILADAAAAGEHPSLSVASALAHVAAARKALRPTEADGGYAASERDAA